MWYADLVCDFEWFQHSAGALGTPRLKADLPCPVADVRTELCLYGSDIQLHHARVLIDVDSYAQADDVSNSSIHYWISVIAVTSGLASGHTLSPKVLPGTNSFAIVLGEGDESSQSLTLTLPPPPKIDFASLAGCISNWQPEAVPYLVFLGRFLDKSSLLGARWLNGYLLAEWYFQRGSAGLANNRDWRTLLEQFRVHLEPHLRPGQTLHGFMEATRALAAHAQIDDRPIDQRVAKRGDAVTWSFEVVGRIVSHIANLPEISRGVIKLPVEVYY